jgi:hypothetical protein
MISEKNLWKYLKRQAAKSAMPRPALMKLAWSSVAALSMAPLQDLLNLGKEARMNVPGVPTAIGAGAARKTCCPIGLRMAARSDEKLEANGSDPPNELSNRPGRTQRGRRR